MGIDREGSTASTLDMAVPATKETPSLSPKQFGPHSPPSTDVFIAKLGSWFTSKTGGEDEAASSDSAGAGGTGATVRGRPRRFDTGALVGTAEAGAGAATRRTLRRGDFGISPSG